MAVGCAVALILDNILPGTAEERGTTTWVQDEDGTIDDEGISGVSLHVYDPISPKLWMNKPWLKYVPFLPYYPNERKEREDNVQVELVHVKSHSEK